MQCVKESEILCTGNSFYPLILSALAGRLNYPTVYGESVVFSSQSILAQNSKTPSCRATTPSPSFARAERLVIFHVQLYCLQ